MKRETRDVTLRIRGDATQLDRSLKRIEQSTGRTARGIDRVSRSLGRLTTAVSGVGVAFAAIETFQFAQSIVRASDSVATLTLQMQGLGGTFDQAFDSAQELGVPLEDIGAQINLLGPAISKLGGSFQDALEFSSDLTQSLRVFGVSGQQANSIVTQLSQSLSSGQLSGDELKSISENAAGLYPALEEAIQGILGSEEALKALGSQGVLTSDVVYKAFNQVFDDVEGRFAELPDTLEQQEARIVNAWTKLLDALDDKLEVSDWYRRFTGGIQTIIEQATTALEEPDYSELTLEEAEARALELFTQIDRLNAQLRTTTRDVTRAALETRLERLNQEYTAMARILSVGEERIPVEEAVTDAIEEQTNAVGDLAPEYTELVKLTDSHVDSIRNLERAYQSLAISDVEFASAVKELNDQLGEAFVKAYEATNGIGFIPVASEEAGRAIEKTTDQLEEFGRTVTQGVGGAFEDLFTGAIKSANDFVDRLGEILLGGVARIAAQLLNTSIVVPIVGAFTGAGGSPVQAATGGAASASQGFSLLSGVSNFFTGNQFTTNLAQGIADGMKAAFGEIPAVLDAVSNIAATSTFSLVGGGIAGGLVGNALFGDRGYGGIGSAAGSSLGALAGSAFLTPFLGPFAPLVGGLLGGAGGGFLGSLFGTGTEPYARFNISEGQIQGAGGAKLDDELYEQASAYIDYVNQSLVSLGDALGAEAEEARLAYSAFSEKLDPDEIAGYLQSQTRGILEAMVGAVPGALGDLIRESAQQVGYDIDQFGGALQTLNAQLLSFGAAVNTLQPGSFETLEDIAERFVEIGTEDAIGLTSGLQGLAVVMNELKSEEELLEEATERARDTFEEAGYVLPETTEALRDWVAGLEMGTQAGLEAAAMAGEISADLLKVVRAGDIATASVQDYADALIHVDNVLGATRQGIEEFGLSELAIYERRRGAADELVDALGAMTDPTRIAATVDEINTLIGEGWNVLTEGQKELMKGSFLAYLDEVEELAGERLRLGVAPLLEEGETLDFSGTMTEFARVLTNVDDSMKSSAEGLENSSDRQKEAATLMIEAVRAFNQAVGEIPSRLVVTTREAEVIL